MRVTIQTYVPEGADFLDEGWQTESFELPGPVSPIEALRLFREKFWETEVTTIRFRDKAHPVHRF